MPIHILFIHSSVDTCMSCFYFSAIMNNAAMSICMHIFVCTYSFSYFRHYWGVELAVNVEILWLLLHCFPNWLYCFKFPLDTYDSSNFMKSLPEFIFVYGMWYFFLIQIYGYLALFTEKINPSKVSNAMSVIKQVSTDICMCRPLSGLKSALLC